MKLRRLERSALTVAAIVLTAAFAACSKAYGPESPGSASQGDHVNLSGTYDLAAFTGGTTIDQSDGATLVLGTSTYNIQGFGTYSMIGPDSGTYVAIDTSSVTGLDAGTVTLTSSISGNGTTSAAYVISHDSLTVNVVQQDSSVQHTMWIKQD